MVALVIKRGDKYGDLKIIKEVEPYKTPSGQTKRRFKCRCVCGDTKEIKLQELRRGDTKSCGCKTNTYISGANTVHGFRNHSLYFVWNSIVQRCTNEDCGAYKNYGGRGIYVCKRWINSPDEFCKWAISNGWKPGLDIDRIDNDGPYKPSNCHFVARTINVRNRRNTQRVEIKGVTIAFAEAHEKYAHPSVSYETARARIKRGWSVWKALRRKL